LTQAGRGAFLDQLDDAKRGYKGLKDLLTEPGGFLDKIKGERISRTLEIYGILDIEGKSQEEISEEISARFGRLLDGDLNLEVKFYDKDSIGEIPDFETLAKLSVEGFAVASDGSIWINKDNVANNTLDLNKIFAHEISHLLGGNETVANYVERAYGEFLGGIAQTGYVDANAEIREWSETYLTGTDLGRFLGYGLDELEFKTISNLTYDQVLRYYEFARTGNSFISDMPIGASLVVYSDNENILVYAPITVVDKLELDGTYTIDLNLAHSPLNATDEYKMGEEIYLNMMDEIINGSTKYLVQLDGRLGGGDTPNSAYLDIPRTQVTMDDIIVVGEAYLFLCALLSGDAITAQRTGERIAMFNTALHLVGKDPIGDAAYRFLKNNFPDSDHSDTAKFISGAFNIAALNAGNLNIGVNNAIAGISGKERAINTILNAERTGTALTKEDKYHRATTFINAEHLRKGQVFNIVGKDKKPAVLLQVDGELNGKNGIFEYIIRDNKVTHQLFIKGKKINGVPN